MTPRQDIEVVRSGAAARAGTAAGLPPVAAWALRTRAQFGVTTHSGRGPLRAERGG